MCREAPARLLTLIPGLLGLQHWEVAITRTREAEMEAACAKLAFVRAQRATTGARQLQSTADEQSQLHSQASSPTLFGMCGTSRPHGYTGYGSGGAAVVLNNLMHDPACQYLGKLSPKAVRHTTPFLRQTQLTHKAPAGS